MRSFTLSIWIITFVMLSLAWVPVYAVREQIAYVQRIGNGGVDLYVADVRGENPRRIVNDVASERPAWSPDGRQIAFVSEEHLLYVIDMASEETQLISPRHVDWHPSWSPDGYQLVSMTVGLSLWVFDLRAGTEREIPNTVLGNSPAWSPNGKQLAIRDSQDGNWDIRIVDIDSGHSRWLVEVPTEEGYPTWSPDGRKLAFNSWHKRESQIYVTDIDRNNKIQQLTALPFTAEAPTWSPDGTQIAFTGWNAQGVKGIYVVSAEGGKPELLIPNGSLPAWCCPSTQFAITLGEKLTTTWGVVKNGF